MASGFELTGTMGMPSLKWAIVIGLAAQITAFTAGAIAAPHDGKIGFVRAIVFLFYIVQTMSLSIYLLAFVYGHFHHVDLLDPNQMMWVLVQGFTALGRGLISLKAWYLSKRAAGGTPFD